MSGFDLLGKRGNAKGYPVKEETKAFEKGKIKYRGNDEKLGDGF